MSEGKRKKRKSDAKPERHRFLKLAEECQRRNEVKMPEGAVPADPSQQVPNNSYSSPPTFYVDYPFVCEDCGQREIWTAQQQKWYYEVAKGSLYARAIRCDECRRKHSEQHQGHGDPNPIKHVGSLMKRIRSNIEPSLLEAEFQFDGKNKVSNSRAAWIEYSRPDLIFRCLFDPREARLVAETMDDKTEYKVVANVALCSPRSTSTLLDRVDEFTSTVQDYLRTLRGAAGAGPTGSHG